MFEPLALLLPSASVLILVWMWARGKKQLKVTVAIQSIFAGVLVGCFLTYFYYHIRPPVAHVSRHYYHGKDEFEWSSQLQSSDQKLRREAILALCAIAKATSSEGTRAWILNELADLGAEAREAVPTLIELMSIEEEVQIERLRQIRFAIERIEPASIPNMPKVK